MTAAGVPREHVKAVLDHAESDVTSVYDRYRYDREKRAALEMLDRMVGEALAGKPRQIAWEGQTG